MNAEAQKVALPVVAWLRGDGWDTWHDVAGIPNCGDRRADIVAVKGDVVHVIECKVSFGWPVLAQAESWLGWAQRVSVATLLPAGRRHDGLRARAADGLGLGWIGVSLSGSVSTVSWCGVDRGWTWARVAILLGALREEHKATTPGNADGAYYTEHQDRCRRLAEVVAAEPGVDLDRALRLANYPVDRQGRRALVTRLRRGYVDLVEARVEGRRVLLWPAEESF